MLSSAILLDTPDQGQEILGSILPAAEKAGLRLRLFAGTDRGIEDLTNRIAAGDEPSAFLIGPNLQRPLAAARKVHQLAPLVQIIFLVDGERESELQQDLSLAPMIGNDWSIARLDVDELAHHLGTAARSTAQRRQLRTTLDDINLQITSWPTDNGLAYRRLFISDRYLATILAHAPVAIVSTDPSGIISTWNLGAQQLFQLPEFEAIGRRIEDIAVGQWAGEIQTLMQAVQSSQRLGSREVAFRRADGATFNVDLVVAPVREEKGGLMGISVIAHDITDRKRAEKALRRAHDLLELRVEDRTKALRESEQRFELAVRGTNEGIWDWNILTDSEWWSEQFHALLGYEHGEIEADYGTFQRLLHPEDRNATLEAVQAHLKERAPYDVEFRLRMKSGDYRWFRSRGQAVWDETGKPLQMAGSIQDITDRKQAEEALKAEQHFLQRLIDVQEQERRMVAHDIHDGFLQDVVGAHMHVQSINSAAKPDANESMANRVGTLLQIAIGEGRRMIRDLRPIVLDDEGIVEAIRHLIADERTHADLAVDFEHDVQFDRLEPRLEGVIFRIVQEALNNVKKHGRTDHAAVKLKQQNGMLEIFVRDQGVGFDAGNVSSDRFGLRGIRERARLFGGTAKIVSAPGKGTEVRVELPVDAPTRASVAAEERVSGYRTEA